MLGEPEDKALNGMPRSTAGYYDAMVKIARSSDSGVYYGKHYTSGEWREKLTEIIQIAEKALKQE